MTHFLAILVVLGLLPASARSQNAAPIDTLHNTVRQSEDTSSRGFLYNQFAFGGSAGTPGGLNAIGEKYWGPVGVRAELGALPFIFSFISGWQANVSYVLRRSPHSLLEVTTLYSRSYTTGPEDDGTWRTAYGLGLSINAGGVFFELSVGHTLTVDHHGYREEPKGLINSWPMTFQIGYVH